ncbi:MAG: HlyD family efflux transporter periplasmic adaptor subunit [Desulfovibrio sp.]|uniref:HlyD family efflux transporter periplasmic adaptor subunit n=1 Tax=Desulfovibrio sp. 7SRBS1 TaxID=3378064 RepID=UPI003B423FD8
MATSFEHNQLRKAHRLKIPVDVEIAGHRLSVKDWSVEGFRAELPEDVPANGQACFAEGWTGTVVFRLPMRGADIAVPLEARLARCVDGDAGFSFVNGDASKHAALSSYMRAALTGKLDDFDAIIQDVESASQGLESSDPLETKTSVALKRSFASRVALYLTAVAVLVGVGAWLSGFALGRFSSDSAYITSPLVECAPPVNGILGAVEVSEGQHVEPKQLLFVIEDKTMLRDVEERQANLDRMRQEVALAQARVKEERTAYSLYKDAAQRDIQGSLARLRSVEAQLDYARKEAERTRKLLAQQAISRSMHEANESRVRELEAEKEGLQEAVAFGKSNVRASKQGKYLANGKAQGNILSLESQVRITQLDLHQAEIELAQAENQLADTRCLAPVSGTVYNIAEATGSYVRQGHPVVQLLPDNGKRQVTAWFSPSRAQYLRPGMDVQVFLTSQRKYVAGKVQNIGLPTMNPGSDAPRRVPAEITLADNEKVMPGTAAMVFVRTGLLDILSVRLGINS